MGTRRRCVRWRTATAILRPCTRTGASRGDRISRKLNMKSTSGVQEPWEYQNRFIGKPTVWFRKPLGFSMIRVDLRFSSSQWVSADFEMRNLRNEDMDCFISILASSKLYGDYHKWGYPQIIHFNGMFHYKPTIFGIPPFMETPIQQFAMETTTMGFFYRQLIELKI